MKIDSPRLQKLFVLLAWSRPSESSLSVIRSITTSPEIIINGTVEEESRGQLSTYHLPNTVALCIDFD
jgi:hypothetical protein